MVSKASSAVETAAVIGNAAEALPSTFAVVAVVAGVAARVFGDAKD